jgi:hypothetical protein
MKFTNPFTKLGASVSTFLMSQNAFAQANNLQTMSTFVSSQVYQVTDLITTGAYVAGAGLGMAGILKLKAHAENPGQHPISQGAGRLIAGGALVALPWMVNNAVGTLGSNANTTGTGVSGSVNRLEQ